jgi:hypothetical protein
MNRTLVHKVQKIIDDLPNDQYEAMDKACSDIIMERCLRDAKVHPTDIINDNDQLRSCFIQALFKVEK